LAALLLTSAAVAPAWAQQQDQKATNYRFAIQGIPLEEALRRYARITGRQVIFQPETFGSRRTPELVGTFDADTALSILLKGVPVQVERVRTGVLVISPLTRGAQNGERQTETNGTADTVAEPEAAEVVITGTIIRGTGPAGASVATINRKEMDRSTRATVADIVALIPQNSGGTGTDAAVFGLTDRTSQNSSLASSPNLRGLGSDATLTLINGRRQAGSGGRANFADLSSVPLAAVERIEILKDGASAIYGSDAVGGVVNVILKNDFRGANTRLRSGIGEGGSPANNQASQVVGTTWKTGGILAAYEYDYRGSLASADRAATRSADLRPLGGNDWRLYYSAPATILSYDPVARAYVPGFAVPTYTDRPTSQDFMPGSNLENQFALSDTLPSQERHSTFLRVRQHAFQGVELFGEARWSRRQFAYASSPSSSLFVVTAANPYFASPDGSPFSVVAYSFGDDLGAARATGWADSASLTGGVTADLGSSWQLDTYYLFSRERAGDRTTNTVNSTALSEALGTSPDDPATPFRAARDGYFNPYGSGMSNNETVLRFIGSGHSGAWRRSSLSTAVAKLDGPLFRVPAGSLRVAIGGAWRRETLSSNGYNFVSGTAPTPTLSAYAGRSIGAGFGEVSLPVFDQDAGFGAGRLRMSAAVRYESYSDFGGTTNPKIGATWSLSRALELRGSWGTSFRAPALPEVYSPFRVTPTQLSSPSGATLPVLILSGGNQGLRPETADTLSFGVVLKPAAGLRLDVGYFRTVFDDRIDRPGIQNVTRALTDPTLAPFVSLIDPANNPADLVRVEALAADPGAIDVGYFPLTSYRAIIDGRYVNTRKVAVEGLDVDLSGSADVLGGTLTANVGAAYLFRFSQQLTPAAPVNDISSTVGYPSKLKARSSVDWSGGPFGLTLSSTYVDSYRNTDFAPAPRVGSWMTFDLQIRARVGGDGGFTFSLDARNLFDRAPPFVNRSSGVGYDPANADVLGRNISVQVTKTW
jgi:outer membrane receptor protein involved in Fe transport